MPKPKTLPPKTAVLTPAYGRDYKSAEAARRDFDADKDFVLNDPTSKWFGKYINYHQVIEAGYDSVEIRFNGKADLTFFNL